VKVLDRLQMIVLPEYIRRRVRLRLTSRQVYMDHPNLSIGRDLILYHKLKKVIQSKVVRRECKKKQGELNSLPLIWATVSSDFTHIINLKPIRNYLLISAHNWVSGHDLKISTIRRSFLIRESNMLHRLTLLTHILIFQNLIQIHAINRTRRSRIAHRSR
jgi:hypothetical protein